MGSHNFTTAVCVDYKNVAAYYKKTTVATVFTRNL